MQVARQCGGPLPAEPLGLGLIDWIAGCGLVYGALFGIGKLVLGHPLAGALYLAVAVACFGVILFGPGRQDRAPAAPDGAAVAASEGS